MPGQSLTVILTFWTLVYWFASLKGSHHCLLNRRRRGRRASGRPHWRWSLFMPPSACPMRVVTAAAKPIDALWLGLSIRHQGSEPVPDGGPGRRWTDLESLSVVPVRGKVLKLVAWIDHPDGDERPVHVRIWVDKKIVYDDDLKRSDAIRRDIPAPPGETHIVVETEISRTWRPKISAGTIRASSGCRSVIGPGVISGIRDQGSGISAQGSASGPKLRVKPQNSPKPSSPHPQAYGGSSLKHHFLPTVFSRYARIVS